MIKKDNYTLLDLRELEKIVTTKIDPHIDIPRMEIPQRNKELDKEKSIVTPLPYEYPLGTNMSIFRTAGI